MSKIVDQYYQAYQYLHKGDYKNGFRLFEFRWHPETIATLPKPFKKLTNQPVWRGEPLKGKSITVQMEMGYGDCIQFIRFVPYLKLLGAKKVVLLQTKSLHELFCQVPGVDAISNNDQEGDAVDTDFWIGSMSLPFFILWGDPSLRYLFPLSSGNVVGRGGYLDAKPLPLGGKLRIGVNWEASRLPTSKPRNISVEEVRRLMDCVPQGTYYSLNPDNDFELEPLPTTGWKTNWGITARYMKSMDYVVTVDTGTAHLAGALGVPCLLLQPPTEYCCWRWRGPGWYDFVIRFDYPGLDGVIRYLREVVGDGKDDNGLRLDGN